jgi:hypothetical protein
LIIKLRVLTPDPADTTGPSDNGTPDHPDLSDPEPWIEGYQLWKENAENSGDSIEMPGEVVPNEDGEIPIGELPLIDPLP